MTYKEAMKRFKPGESKATFIRLYYEDQGWHPCVPLLATTRARLVPHPSNSTHRCIRVVEEDHDLLV